MHRQLRHFNETMLKLERQKTCVVEGQIFTELKLNLLEKKKNNYISYQEKCLLEKLEKESKIDAKVFCVEI